MLVELLVIGYGNILRGDDGVGPKVAEAVAALNLPGVRTLARHQLTPELADPISESSAVVFVDATIDSDPAVSFCELTPAGSGDVMTHMVEPQTLLTLARDVFGRSPAAWWLKIPVRNLHYSEELSAPAKAGMNCAIEKIKELIEHRCDKNSAAAASRPFLKGRHVEV